MALRYDRRGVFAGSFWALLLHTFIAAALGIAISRFFAPGMLNLMAAALYLIFALVCTHEWLNSSKEKDVFLAGKEEAASAVDVGPAVPSGYGADVEATNQATGKSSAGATQQSTFQVLCQC